MNYNERITSLGQPEYDKHFWNTMRGDNASKVELANEPGNGTGTYALPSFSENKYAAALREESLFRKIGTVIKAYDCVSRIMAKSCNELAQWVPENGSIPFFDGMNDFTIKAVDTHKLAAFVKLDSDFVHDASFNIESYLVERLAKNFGRAEEKAFITGSGQDEPIGILNGTGGADVGVTTPTLTYDDVISLYFSLKPEYRKNAVWLMNDQTALTLRTLKDSAGNYLWRGSDDTILGKPVLISEYMPDVSAGSKPIAIGDFRYYWLVDRSPVGVRTITEKFAALQQVGYLAYELLDAKLVRSEAIKVIQMAE